MYRKFVGPKLGEHISVTSLTARTSTRLLPMQLGLLDVFVTAITLAVFGWFIAYSKKLSYELQCLYTCIGFIFGLFVDIALYIIKASRDAPTTAAPPISAEKKND